MLRHISNWLLYGVMGWKKHITMSIPEKCIICLAPHTSNWDFILGQLYSHAEGIRINYLMKKEWFFWPLKYLFYKTGGIPVHREKNTNLTDTLAENATSSQFFRLCVTPEGTRKPNSQWKKGFYFIAQKAGIPILLYGLDYERKLIECTKVIHPSGDIEKQLPEIQQYFKGYKGKHPENFKIPN